MKKIVDFFCRRSNQLGPVVNVPVESEVNESVDTVKSSTAEVPKIKEEVILEYLHGQVTFDDVVQFMAREENAYFDHESDTGKLVCEALTLIGEKRAKECTSFEEGSSVYNDELGPITRDTYHLRGCVHLTRPIYRRVNELAEQQRSMAEQKMDLAILQKLLEDAKRVEGFWNFWVPFRNSIWAVVDKKLEEASDIDDMIEIYQEAKDAKCEIARGCVSEAIAEFLSQNRLCRKH